MRAVHDLLAAEIPDMGAYVIAVHLDRPVGDLNTRCPFEFFEVILDEAMHQRSFPDTTAAY